jgi:enoyl-CoA hydratase/carnithine racemase
MAMPGEVPSEKADLVRTERDASCERSVRLVLDDPRHANALSPALTARLHDALHDAIASEAKTIVFDSSSERFCAGFDLRDAEAFDDAALRERFDAVEALLESVRRAPAVTIAVVRGPALGAGADLVAACDYRIGTSQARFAFPGSRFGVVLGTRHLAGVVGRQAALETLVEGRTLDADAALRCGLLSEARSPESLQSRIDEIARHCASIDIETLRAMLRLIRSEPSELDRAELRASAAREGFGERVREHARRVREARDARRSRP